LYDCSCARSGQPGDRDASTCASPDHLSLTLFLGIYSRLYAGITLLIGLLRSSSLRFRRLRFSGLRLFRWLKRQNLVFWDGSLKTGQCFFVLFRGNFKI
jgi:hypothetical protein